MVQDALNDPFLSFRDLIFKILRRCLQIGVGFINRSRIRSKYDAVHGDEFNDITSLDDNRVGALVILHDAERASYNLQKLATFDAALFDVELYLVVGS